MSGGACSYLSSSYLSPSSASFFEKCCIISALVGKAYEEAGQAGGSLHTMVVLQAYQADLLKELDTGEGLSSNMVKELCRATDQTDGPRYRPFNGSHGSYREAPVAKLVGDQGKRKRPCPKRDSKHSWSSYETALS